MVSLSVAGSAHHLHPAERGTLRIEARLESPTRQDAVSAVAQTHSRLAQRARAFEESGAVTRFSSDQVQASSYFRFDSTPEKGETVHVASAGLQVRFRDFEKLSEWVTEISADPVVTVQGIEWGLTRSTREAEQKSVRIEAVQDARERAEAYAAALGLSRVTAVRLAEPGTDLDASAQEKGRMMMRSAAFGAPSPTLALCPEPIEVSASVIVVYEGA